MFISTQLRFIFRRFTKLNWVCPFPFIQISIVIAFLRFIVCNSQYTIHSDRDHVKSHVKCDGDQIQTREKTKCTFQEFYQLYECYLYFEYWKWDLHEMSLTWNFSAGNCRRISPSFSSTCICDDDPTKCTWSHIFCELEDNSTGINNAACSVFLNLTVFYGYSELQFSQVQYHCAVFSFNWLGDQPLMISGLINLTILLE